MLLAIHIALEDPPLCLIAIVIVIVVNRNTIRVRRDHVHIGEHIRWTNRDFLLFRADGCAWGKVICSDGWDWIWSRLSIWFVRLAASCLEAPKGTGAAPAKFPYLANNAAYCLKGECCPARRSRAR